MSASTAIGMVGETLRQFLDDEMLITPNVNITLLGPDESGGGNRRINLFLYKVEQNAHLRNMDWQPSLSDPSQLTPPPLSLNLYYLMTAYAQNDPQTGNTTAHEILGDAMRVFYEKPIVPDMYLVPGLIGAREQLRISQNHVDLDELSKVWSTFSEPFRLSVPYEVSVVQLDQSSAGNRDMPQRVTEIGIPQVEAPFVPPTVDDMTPASGVAGTSVTFTGTRLDGWQASARVFGRTILDGHDIVGDSFSATIPADLPVGFHEIRVDISRLHRKTFFFEVLP